MNSDDQTEYYEGYVNGSQGSDAFDRKLYITRFTQRDLYSTQLFGEHVFKFLNNSLLDWKFSYSNSNRKEPDIKTMTYQRDFNGSDPFYAAINPNFGNTYAGGRFFSNLNDINRSFSVNIETPFSFNIPFSSVKITNTRMKIGSLLNGNNRNFSARNFGVGYYIGMPFNLLYQPVDKIFQRENFDVNKLFYDELTTESDKYTASENTYAAYTMFDIPINKLRIIFGARYEYDEQRVNTLGIIGNPVSRYVKNNDILPSINLVYKLTEKANFRAAYSQTISRPELREIAPFSYVDFVTGILVLGNSIDLHRTIVRNYDIRYEIFPQPGEIISFSLFYKKIDSPIEEVFIPTTTNRLKTFKNAEAGAYNYGAEIELRKNLGFILKTFENFSINGNFAIINSKVSFEGVTTTATTKERRLQGQSPYMINLGLFYDNYDLGTNVNLTYNRFGERIMEVGTNGYNDIRELPRDFLDFTASKKIFGKIEIKFSVKDIMNQKQKFVQLVSGKDETIILNNSGISYSLGITYKY
jgi:TonB-dependent receptor